MITRDAYVLFYRRRETKSTIMINKPLNIQQNNNDEEFYSCEEEEEDDDDDDDCSSSSSASFTNLDALD